MAQQAKLGTHATTVSTDHEGFMVVTYHSTQILRWNSERIILKVNGYRTATTKTRMNQASNQFRLGFKVFQKDFNWFVHFNGDIRPFEENMELTRIKEV